MRLRFVLVLCSMGALFARNDALASQTFRGRKDAWSFQLLFDEKCEIAIARVTSVTPPPTGEVHLAISKMIWGSPRSNVHLPNEYFEDLRVGEEYVVGYSVHLGFFIAMAEPESELLDLLSAYAAMRSRTEPGEIPLDEDGAFMDRIFSLMFHESPVGQLARGFIANGRLRRSLEDPFKNCCEIAMNLTSADWSTIERAVTDSSVDGSSRSIFLMNLGLSTYLRNGPSMVTKALIDWSRSLRRWEGTSQYTFRKDDFSREVHKWRQYFEIPDRIRYYELLQQSGEPILVQIGKNLPEMPWYKNEMKMRAKREAQPQDHR